MSRRDWLLLALLWLGGFNLRVTMLAVPPIIPDIRRDLHLGYSAIGALTGLPILIFAAGAIPAALLIAWLGARKALLVGMSAVAVASALRGAGPNAAVLYAMTLVMAAGVAVSQTGFPSLVVAWLPARIGFATAVYINGSMVGETVPAAATGPLLLPAVRGSWEWSLVAWALPVALLLCLAVLLTREPAHQPAELPARRLPDFRSRHLWLAGLTLGIASAAYWGANTFIPGFVNATGRPELKDAALASLNATQLLASLAALVAPGRLMARRWPFVAMGAMLLIGFTGMLLAPGSLLVVFAGLVGFATALAFILTMALPALLVAPSNIATFSAGIFLISYLMAFVGPVLGGAAWDATHAPQAPFILLAGSGAVAMLLGWMNRHQPAAGAALRHPPSPQALERTIPRAR